MSLAPQDSGIIQNSGVSFAVDAQGHAEDPGGTQQTGRGAGRPAPCLIPLPGGLFTLVSPEDFDRATAHRWHVKRKKSQPGKLYVQRTIRLGSGRTARKTAETLHRFIVGARPGEVVDHRNGNGLDNQRLNLRHATNRQNAQNVTLSANQKRGGFKGVSWNPRAKKWQAAISGGPVKPNGRRARVYLGVFVDPADAARAYDAAAREHFGEWASLNFPDAANDQQTQALGGTGS